MDTWENGECQELTWVHQAWAKSKWSYFFIESVAGLEDQKGSKHFPVSILPPEDGFGLREAEEN